MADLRSDWFISRVSALLASCKGRTLLFFRGFAWPQVYTLLQHPQALLPGLACGEEEGLSVSALCAQQDALLAAAMAADGPRLGIYEELLAMRQRLEALDGVRILVVENELLAPWQPSLLRREDVLALFDYLQGEKKPESEILYDLSRFYGEVRLLGSDEALLIAAPIEADNIETVVFFGTEPAGEVPEKDDPRERLFTVKMQVKTTLVDAVIDSGSQKNLISQRFTMLSARSITKSI